MKKTVLLFSLALLVLGGYASSAHSLEMAQAPAAQTAPDNTGRNIQDRSGVTLTPGNQSESEVDRTLTQRIRRAVVADEALSTTAKNVKIITINGVVTLRVPVKSPQEKVITEAKARQIAGADKVDNQPEIIEQ
jgi:osmotically-inducible protein OsmY